VRRALEFSGSPEQLASHVTRTFTTHGWTATPSSETVVTFKRSFGAWSGDVVLVVEARGVAVLTGRVGDGTVGCQEPRID
jgi:hypothetical protein